MTELPPTLEPALFPRGIDEYLPHRLRGGGEKVAAALPLPLLGSSQAQPGFVNEGGGLEGVSSRLVPHFQGRKAAQLFVNQGQKLLGGLGFALPHAIENARNVVHGLEGSLPGESQMSIPEHHRCVPRNYRKLSLAARRVWRFRVTGSPHYRPEWGLSSNKKGMIGRLGGIRISRNRL